MTTNLTTEIQIDGGSLTGMGGTHAGGSGGSTGSDHEHAGAPPNEDIINNGTKVTRSQSAAMAGDTTKSTSVHSQAVRRTRTVSSSRSVDEDPVAEEAEMAAGGSSEDLGLIRRTRKKVVNAFK